MKVLNSRRLDNETAKAVIDRIGSFDLDVWVYDDAEWYLRNFDAPHREKEEQAVQFAPKVVSNFTEALQQGVAKVVGVSDKYDLVAEAEKVIQAEFEHGIHARSTTASWDCEPSVSATRSSAYYLDVTHPKANKGAVVEEQQLDLFADRTSTHWMATNPLRLWFSAFAHLLMSTLQAAVLRGTELAEASIGQIRLRLFKIAARLKVSVRRIHIELCPAYPLQGLFSLVHQRLSTLGAPP
jgi:Transposase DDE domain group 1/haloacid dehalogenase-like hydrolase